MGISSAWLLTLSKQLNVLSVVSALLPVVAGLLRRRYLTMAERYLWACALLANLLFAALCEYGRIVLHNNLLFLRTQVWLEAVLLGAAYYHTFTSPRRRRVTLWLLAAFTAGGIIETVWFMDWRVGNSPFLHVSEAVLMIGLVLAYFEQLLSNPQQRQLLREPMFLISVGAVLYFAGTVFVYVLESNLRTRPDMVRIIFILEFGLRTVAFNGFLALALWMSGRTPVSPAQISQ